MYADAIDTMGEQAAAKVEAQRRSLPAHLARSALAGMYVGAAIVLIFTIGAALSKDFPSLVKPVMGACFGGALTIVIFAGSELFTGSNLVLTLGVLTRKTSLRDLLANWSWTWLGNLAGSVLLAVIVVRSGILNAEPFKSFVVKIAQTKMTLPAEQLLWRAVLANWMVCLGVWMAARIKGDAAKVLMIWWCMFTFITCGYEHSVANMCGLMMGLLLPHDGVAGVSLSGYAYNLGLATLGNVVGGAVLVAGMYWLGSPESRAKRKATLRQATEQAQAALGGAAQPMRPGLAYSPDRA
jgi:nitrite transporter NirC